MANIEHIIESRLSELTARYPELALVREDIKKAYLILKDCYDKGGKLMIAGNGGSCSDAQHIVGELMKGFCKKRPLGPELAAAIEDEILSLLFYEEELLAPGLRLDYIHRGSYSFLSDDYYRRGTRFRAVDADGNLRGIFEVSDSYPGAYVLSPVYLDDPFPGISLESEGEWTMFSSAAMGFSFPAVDLTGSLSFGRTDLIYPFVPLASFLFRYENGAMYWYGGLGIEAFIDMHRIFPSVSFTLIEEGRIGADASILLGYGPAGFDWKGRFSVFYEHRATSSFFWRIGYENLQGTHMLMIGLGGDF